MNEAGTQRDLKMTKSGIASERKSQIIDATIECITRYGYNNFSMQDVARIADVSKGIIHYYFLNKEDLMMAVLEKVAGDIEAVLGGFHEQANNPIDGLRFLMKTCFSVVKNKKAYYCVNIDFWTQINQKETVKHAVAKHYNKFRSVAAAIIQKGMDAGVFKKGNANECAALLIALVDGISLQWLFDEQNFAIEDCVKLAESWILEHLKVKS